MFKYVGKSIEVKYDTGFHYKINYLDNENLEWITLGKSIDGAPKNAIEQFFWYEISEDIYAINWIEESGIEIAQVINFKTFDVYAFITWSDVNLKGRRNHSINIGKVSFY